MPINLSSPPLECCKRQRPVLEKAGHAYELRQNRKLRQKSTANDPQRHELGNKGWGDIHGRRTGVQQTWRPHHAAASQRGVAVGEVDGRGDRHAALVHHALLGRPEQDQPEHQEPHRLPDTTGAEEEGLRGRGHSRQASARPAGATRHPNTASHSAAAASPAVPTAAAAATTTSIQDTAHPARAVGRAAEADHPAAAASASTDHRHDRNDGDRQAVPADAKGRGSGGGTGSCFSGGQHANHHGKHHYPAAHVHIHRIGGGGNDDGGAATAPGRLYLLIHADRAACGWSGGVHSALADGCDCRRCREYHLHFLSDDCHGGGGNGFTGGTWGSRRCCWNGHRHGNGSSSGPQVRAGRVHDPEPHQCARKRGGRGGVPSRRGGQAGLCQRGGGRVRFKPSHWAGLLLLDPAVAVAVAAAERTNHVKWTEHAAATNLVREILNKRLKCRPSPKPNLLSVVIFDIP